MTSRTQCIRSELELFSLPPLQTAVEEGQWVEYNPVSSINSAALIEFVVTGSGEEYADLSKTLIEIKAEIRNQHGETIEATNHVAPINNTLHSLFSQLDVSLNDASVSSSTTMYPYRAYIENHLNYGSDAKNSRLSAGLYYKDENITQSDPIPTEHTNVNYGLKERHIICTGKPFDMIGVLHADICNQNRYLLNGVTMRIRFTRSQDQFVLMSNESESFHVEILSAKLLVRKLKISSNLALAHEQLLESKPAKYPITRVEVKVFHLPKGQKSFTHDNLILGNLPKRICIGIVDNNAFNGNYLLNPLNFQHYNVNFLSLHLDGNQIPWAPLKPYFSHNNFIRAYFTQFTGGDGTSSDTGNCIDRDDFKHGNALYCFDLTPDLSSSSSHHLCVTRQGNLRVEFGFDNVLQFTRNVIVYSEFDNVIEIDKDRKVTHDYGG